MYRVGLHFYREGDCFLSVDNNFDRVEENLCRIGRHSRCVDKNFLYVKENFRCDEPPTHHVDRNLYLVEENFDRVEKNFHCVEFLQTLWAVHQSVSKCPHSESFLPQSVLDVHQTV